MKSIHVMNLNHTLTRLSTLLVLTATLTACGGGGDGFPGIRPSTATNTTTAPTLHLALNTAGHAIDIAGTTLVQATVKDASGALVDGKAVTFTGDAALVKFSPASGQVLTVNGVASIQVAPASLSASGAGTVTAQANVAGTTVSDTFGIQLAAANIGLQSLNVGSGSLPAYGNRAISVVATINGAVVTNVPVQVTFNASCGTVTPTVVSTDANGLASSTFTASQSCAGTNVTVSATAVGASSLSSTISVAAPQVTNVQFVSVTPQLIYLKDSVGVTQSQVVFKAVDASGNPIQNRKLRLQLSNPATGVGLNAPGSTSDLDLTTDNLGLVSAALFAGTVPTSLNVRATLLDANGQATSVYSDSNLLTVASGRPTQKSLSLSLDKFSLEAMNVDGQTAKLTLSMADRQGNPVPPGTQVNFVTEAGVVNSSCTVPSATPAASSCTVTLTSQGTRTDSGRVSVLAYVTGEEDFIDSNGNNVYDTGETFTDLGRAYRDDNGASAANGTYDAGEFQVPRTGTSACVVGQAQCTGDGVWGLADVRSQAIIIFASGTATISGSFLTAVEILPVNTGGTYPASLVTPAINLTISDVKGNSVPTGSKVDIKTTDNTVSAPVLSRTAAVLDNNGAVVTPAVETFGTCTLVSPATLTVPNALGPFGTQAVLKNCTTGDIVTVTVTTPLGTQSTKSLTIL